MATTHKTFGTGTKTNTSGSEKSQYVFKSPSQMPAIKRDYVVQAPTPLGQRSDHEAQKRK